MFNIVLSGPPGSGKGTQSKKIIKKYNLYHISTGDIFRYHIKNETELGIKAKRFMDKGLLVSDELTIQMLTEEITKHENIKGFIFDGFPRTYNQAKVLDQLLFEKSMKINLMLFIKVDEEELERRLLNRGTVTKRPDDQNIEIIRNRLKEYNEKTSSIKNYYKQQNKLQIINGIGNIKEISIQINQCIENTILNIN